MTIFRRMMVAMAALAGVMVLFAGNALAGTKQVPMGYCGPSFSSKTAMISWYQSHAVQRARAEVWVRSHAAYYHIQPDQSFIAWLSMPNVKYKMAPAGYTLQHNTRCDGVGNVIQYDHKLGVSKLPMLWWCANANGSGSGCVPIAKYYCRNFVMGRKVFPTPKVAKKPVVKSTPTSTPSGSCNVTITGTVNGNVINCSTFTNTVTCGNLSQTFTGSSSTDVASQATKWQQANCVTNTPPPLTCQTPGATNIGGPLPCQFTPPPPTCQTQGATNIGGSLPCQFPPPVVVTFTMSFDTINDIPAGTCRPETLHVTSSVAGKVQVSPNIGLISTIDCYQPNTGQLSLVNLSVNAGSQDLTVYVYEPTDTSATSDTLTAVPLITGVDAKNNTATTSFTVSHPTRP